MRRKRASAAATPAPDSGLIARLNRLRLAFRRAA